MTILSRLPPLEISNALAALSAGETTDEIYHYVGLEWLEFMIDRGRITPDSRVLDIGCGSGRMAVHLERFLSDDGGYAGFDPFEKSIRFAEKRFTRKNFEFHHIDLAHHLYNPKGAIDPLTFVFPFAPASFDFAFAASVFSHFGRAETEAYLRQLERVLKPGGRAMLSFFALTPAYSAVDPLGVTDLLGHGDSLYAFRFKAVGDGVYRHCHPDGSPRNHYTNDDQLGDPVAYEVDRFRAFVAEAGLNVVEVLPGSWCRNEYRFGYQDILFAEKPS